MNQTELYTNIAEEVGLTPKHIKQVFDTYKGYVEDELTTTGELLLPGLGIFRKVDRPERMGRNPGTGEQIKIAAKSVVKFVVKKSLKDAVMK